MHPGKPYTKISFPSSLCRNLLFSAAHVVLFLLSFYAPQSLLSLSGPPSPPFSAGCRGDRVRERHFFPEAPPLSLSPSRGFVQPALPTGSTVCEAQGGTKGSKHLCTPLFTPRGASGELYLCGNGISKEPVLAELIPGDKSDAFVLMLQLSPLPSYWSWYGLVQSQLVGCARRG